MRVCTARPTAPTNSGVANVNLPVLVPGPAAPRLPAPVDQRPDPQDDARRFQTARCNERPAPRGRREGVRRGSAVSHAEPPAQVWLERPPSALPGGGRPAGAISSRGRGSPSSRAARAPAGGLPALLLPLSRRSVHRRSPAARCPAPGPLRRPSTTTRAHPLPAGGPAGARSRRGVGPPTTAGGGPATTAPPGAGSPTAPGAPPR